MFKVKLKFPGALNITIMSFTLADQYYLKASASYPWCLEEVLENLNYALSYDENHAGANYLMGKFYMEQYQDFENAEDFFVKVLSTNPYHVKACEAYVMLLIRTGKFSEAQRLIDFAGKIKGANAARLYRLKSLVYEHQRNYGQAIESLKFALLESFSQSYINFLSEEMNRIEQKMHLLESWNYKIV